MDTSDDIAVTLSPLEQRRAALRALSDDIMDVIKNLTKPQSWLEGDRAMRCLGTTDRVVVQLFSKVRAPAPAERTTAPALSARPAASVSAPVPAPMPEPEAPFVYIYDDEEDDDAPADTDGGKALDAALDNMEALLDAIDRGERPKPPRRPAPVSQTANGQTTPYHAMAQHLARGRNLIMDLATAPP